MRRAAIVTFGLLIALLVGSQLLLPPIVEGRIEERMEEGGGSASAEVSALPALRLLTRHGDRLEVSGRELRFELAPPREKVFKDLDGFDEVDVRVVASRVGPILLDRVVLVRDGEGEPYSVALNGTVSGQDLASYLGGRFGGPLGAFLGGIAAGNPLAQQPLPFAASAEIESDDGVAKVTDSEGSVAGFPVGPLAEIVASAVVARL